MSKIDDLITPAVKNYVTLCRKYCAYLEQLSKEDSNRFYEEMLVMLPGIYRGAMRLPLIKSRYAYEPEKMVTERMYKAVYKRLADQFKNKDRYSELADPAFPENMRVIECSAVEILADIYQEVKDFVLLFERGTLEEMNDAVAECQTAFKDKLGSQLLSVAHLLHTLCYQPIPDVSQLYGGYDTHNDGPDESEQGYEAEELNGYSEANEA